MASDNFAATNNPLASPWQAVTGQGALESSGGVTFAAIHDVESSMIYSTSSVQSSQVTIMAYSAGTIGPALMNPSTGDGYYCSRPAGGTQLIIVRNNGGTYSGDSGTVAFVTVVNDLIRLYINGSNALVMSVNGTDRHSWADTTHRTGLQPGIRAENESDTADDWTDGAAGGGRTALNTRSNPLGVNVGMGWRMPNS